MKDMKSTRVLLVEDNAVNARLVQTMLSNVETHRFQISTADTLLAALDLLVHSEFDVAIVDLTLTDSQGLETFLTIKRHAPGIPVIILTGIDDQAMALAGVQQGAQDYLVKGKLNKETLVRALIYAIARSQKPAETTVRTLDRASIAGLLGSNGGVGTTTLAAHWAVHLARQTDQKVLLIDLDFSSSGASFLMKIDSPYSVLDATENLHRLDADMWKGIVSHFRDNLDVLPCPGASGIREAPTAERIRHVLRFAQPFYSWIIVDLGRLTAASLAVLEETRDLFLVTTPELPALFEASRILRRLLEAGLSRERMHLLLNRQPKKSSFSVEDIEKALGYPVYGAITDTPEEIAEAYAEKRFLHESLQIDKQIGQILRKWRGVDEKAPAGASRSLFRRLRTA
jgi:Flp pilus assembly CpaE family ATPase